ncbi:MAG: DUF1002 domain-containing protein [Lachnospiraceae bacterium]|nr:DUF1002 domain-containing protein [Lachnospiraceae bacterium]
MKFSKKLTAVLLSAFCLAAAVPSVPAMADSQKVVTLGADLTEEQQTMILKYFGIYGESNIETLTITNADEREHLGSYIPLEQIGTRTYSCALVSPTTSGGIQVKTANLTYVTSNMIASTLSTAGVVNCEVLAAAPFAVSGTGALTGVLMAYETASGETLDETKKETATQELVTTTTISDSVGTVEATQIVNETKIQVIQGDVVSTGDIEVIVDTVAEEENVTLSDEDRALLVELMEKIAEQDYNYEEMSETLERVEENLDSLLNEESDSEEESTESGTESTESAQDTASGTEDSTESSTESTAAESEESALAEDSILLNTDESALGSDVVFDATDASALAETEAGTETETEASDDFGFDITVSDTYEDTTGSDSSTDTVDADGSADADDSSAQTDGSDIVIDFETSGTEETVDTEAIEIETETETESTVQEIISLSELVLDPNTEEDATETATIEAGRNYLTISTQRTDLVAGTGTISVYNAVDGSLIETVEMSDTTKVISEPITDVEKLYELGEWTEGTEFRIYLDTPFAANMSYYIMIGDDALTTEDGSASIRTTLDNSIINWYFDTLSYGIGLDETVDGVTANSVVTGTLYVDSETSAYALIDSITVDGVETLADGTAIAFTDSSTFELNIGQSGEAVIHVSYYDSADTMNFVNEATYTVTVN